MAQGALQRRDDAPRPCVDMVSELATWTSLADDSPGCISGLDIHYDLGEGHPLLGRRMPDLDLVTADGPLRVFTLLHDARPVLLNLGEPGGFDITPWADRVRLIDAEYEGLWELPVLGEVTAPTAVLIRPDGYVAWVGDGTDPGSLTPSPPGSDRVVRPSCGIALRINTRPTVPCSVAATRLVAPNACDLPVATRSEPRPLPAHHHGRPRRGPTNSQRQGDTSRPHANDHDPRTSRMQVSCRCAVTPPMRAETEHASVHLLTGPLLTMGSK